MSADDLVPPGATQDTKRDLRERTRQDRVRMNEAEAALSSERIGQRFLSLPEVRDAVSVALFWPMLKRREVDLRKVDETLRQRSCKLAYPVIKEPKPSMEFRLLDEVCSLVDSGQGFMQPPAEAELLEELDVIVVPGLLFDFDGFRIGYGGGYYDAKLPRHRSSTTVIGVCYAAELRDKVPRFRHDVPVDIVVTDEKVIRPTRTGA